MAAGFTYGNSVLGSIGRQIRVRPAPSGIVGSGKTRSKVVLQVVLDGILLIVWDREMV
jgi:hypothetical protein